MPPPETNKLSGPIDFMNRTYEEAYDLLVEVRDAVAAGAFRPKAPGNAADSLDLTLESMRMTARLTNVMAWLLMHKAVVKGEVPPETATSFENRLGGRDVCLDATELPDDIVSPYLANLIERTRNLYIRVSRLDELASRP